MVRMIKCQYCLVSDTPKEEMVFDLVGKNQTKKYLHKKCLGDYMEDKEYKRKEREGMDILNEALMEVYNLKIVPSVAFPLLQDLRNGNKFYGKENLRKKEGYSYELIAETFIYCSESIAIANYKKSFDGFQNALRYGLAIVCDKINIVEQRTKHRESQLDLIDKHIENLEDSDDTFETSYKIPSKAKNDISDFLDD